MLTVRTMDKNVTIFGRHPVGESLVSQFKADGAVVSRQEEFLVPDILPDEMSILSSSPSGDSDAEAFLSDLAVAFKESAQKRPVVHLLLRQPTSLRKYQVSDFEPIVNEVFEVFPFTMEEVWAENVIVRLPGIDSHNPPALDREPITADSHQFVHLVIAGFDTYAESIAVKAAQVAHFPNYDGKAKHPLRTRITIIAPGITASKDSFIARYHTLFDNSYYRTVDLDNRKSFLHHPIYEGNREDFVDVEWEFVDGSLSNPVIVKKLSLWAKDSGRQMTLVISGSDDNANVDNVLSLPDALLESDTPVWVRTHKDIISKTLGQSLRYSHVIAFGMDNCGYSIHLPIMQMAKLLHYFYSCSYGAKGIPTSFPQEEVDVEWRKAGPLKMRLSNVCNVLTMSTKMHSLGHNADDVHTFYALTEEEIQSLSRTEHNRWSVERLLSGTRPCTDEERSAIKKDIKLKKQFKAKDIHYDLCAYDELGVDEKGIDVRTYDYALTACIPLIVESFLKEGTR